ncbi:hypothetical protein J2R99_001732 [Rhodopseudomonas julia]|uniref:Uncharacterized protein n=1 Tax=Rhodopseudomonas julia TaxID=200617 RepID=A0ABU0C6R5_9BRAD|nr:hypothetical protein [Rhodopseudomonas julia]MDQ0325883.1 hypothetical protein [Rhodopseudomonas julia]
MAAPSEFAQPLLSFLYPGCVRHAGVIVLQSAVDRIALMRGEAEILLARDAGVRGVLQRRSG